MWSIWVRLCRGNCTLPKLAATGWVRYGGLLVALGCGRADQPDAVASGLHAGDTQPVSGMPAMAIDAMAGVGASVMPSPAFSETDPASASDAPTDADALAAVEALLDPRYDDDIHPGPCPVVEADADMQTLLDKLGSPLRYESLSTRGGPLLVGIVVSGGADYTRVGDVMCPPNGGRPACPERDAALAAVREIDRVSQRCVRAQIELVGGEVVESFGVGPLAALTWQQLVRVVAHPHVLSYSDSEDVAPVP